MRLEINIMLREIYLIENVFIYESNNTFVYVCMMFYSVLSQSVYRTHYFMLACANLFILNPFTFYLSNKFI